VAVTATLSPAAEGQRHHQRPPPRERWGGTQPE
jgi:hypothetical protein